MADAIRIGDPAIEVRLRRNARARRMVLRVAQTGRDRRSPCRRGCRWRRRRRSSAITRAGCGAILAARPAGKRVGDGTVLPFGDGSLTSVPRHRPRGARTRATPAGAGPCRGPGGLRVAAWLREEARRTCVAGVERHAAALGLPAGADQPARPAVALGLVHRDGRPDVLVAAGDGAERGARLRGGARGGASGRAEPFAALLGGGAAALPGLRRAARTGCAATARPCMAATSPPPADPTDPPPLIERERPSDEPAAGPRAGLPGAARADHARAGGAGGGADAARSGGGLRGQHDAGARGGAAAGGGGGAEAVGVGPGLDAGARQRADRGAGGAPGADRAGTGHAGAAAGACGADRPDAGDQRRRSTR